VREATTFVPLSPDSGVALAFSYPSRLSARTVPEVFASCMSMEPRGLLDVITTVFGSESTFAWPSLCTCSVRRLMQFDIRVLTHTRTYRLINRHDH
jgi:hypothetical protein